MFNWPKMALIVTLLLPMGPKQSIYLLFISKRRMSILNIKISKTRDNCSIVQLSMSRTLNFHCLLDMQIAHMWDFCFCIVHFVHSIYSRHINYWNKLHVTDNLSAMRQYYDIMLNSFGCHLNKIKTI